MVRRIDIEGMPEVATLARQLRTHGEALGATVSAAVQAVEGQENHPETFPSDEFTDAFLVNYRQVVDVGQSKTLPANEAIKTSARSMGPAIVDYAEFVVNAMGQYSYAEDLNADGFQPPPTRPA